MSRPSSSSSSSTASTSSAPDTDSPESNSEIFRWVSAGAQDRPRLPHLRSDPPPSERVAHSLREFREREGHDARKKQLRELWHRLPDLIQQAQGSGAIDARPGAKGSEAATREEARKLREAYVRELLATCRNGRSVKGSGSNSIGWEDFRDYALEKEEELWSIFHDELDGDGNGRLEAHEVASALSRAGIELTPATLSDFMTYLTASPHSRAISFREFRDFLLLLPRKASAKEIYRYYQVRKYLGDDGKGAARVTMEGDVTLSAEDRPPPLASVSTAVSSADAESESDDEEHHTFEMASAFKYLMAGGIAGAVSRTCTAPFDRLKIFLITRPPDLGGKGPTGAPVQGLKAIAGAVTTIFAEGGVRAFWVGNGLSVMKIFPESAIKFFSYESSKRFFAKYVDHVEDSRDISGSSRFISGGIGGITSQLSIYPIETLKTQMMSSTGETKRTLVSAARTLWGMGGVPAYYRGLVIGLVGVFPYSAIDMSTFEALKLAYLRSTGKDEPGVLALLAFGSLSGSVGATSVYPLNLVRTRLQASGSSGHPERYTGPMDVVYKTYARDGWRGFYRGLFPTLAKVVPSVSISYVVYESSKKRLGVQ